MDGIHDLGGKEGFGPIAVSRSDPAYETEADARIHALSQTTGPGGTTIDWFRHVVELMPPRAYMTERYFQKWLFVMFIEWAQSGKISLGELLGQSPAPSGPPAPAMDVAEALADVRAHDMSYERPLDTPPAFGTGDRVQTAAHGHSGHTRLPAYARGRVGTILSHRGAHLFPDAGARGQEEAEHLYTVVFAARALWGDAADPRDTVTLDLWESYLVPA